MFTSNTYSARRNSLKKSGLTGLAFFPGNTETPMNYPANTYHFRQDSHFLYFFGLDLPGLAGIIDFDSGDEIIFGDDVDMDDIIWMGPQKLLCDQALLAGINTTQPYSNFSQLLKNALQKGRDIHFLPPYRAENKILIHDVMGIPLAQMKTAASVPLIKEVVKLRSIKEPEEIQIIEDFMDVGWLMHTTAMRMAQAGRYEREIAGAIEGIALSHGGSVSFPVILSKRGETLHNHYHGNQLQLGDLLLIDAGAESPMHYATDHTRVAPVGGKFSQQQKDIYEIVLKANMDAIHAIKPHIPYREIHLLAAKIIAQGLKDLGLLHGNVEDAVSQGAHTLFFPHGLGHMMGLDVHDMEDLGENYVGYDEETLRSTQFGTAYLRLARKLQPGFVLTVEPGIYFIPELIAQWKKDHHLKDFIHYDQVEKFIGFGGIRIEDDVLVTTDGHKVFGRPIPKLISEVEECMKDVI